MRSTCSVFISESTVISSINVSSPVYLHLVQCERVWNSARNERLLNAEPWVEREDQLHLSGCNLAIMGSTTPITLSLLPLDPQRRSWTRSSSTMMCRSWSYSFLFYILFWVHTSEGELLAWSPCHRQVFCRRLLFKAARVQIKRLICYVLNIPNNMS